ncbi:unnamed protein product [Rhodiola kirilowii]
MPYKIFKVPDLPLWQYSKSPIRFWLEIHLCAKVTSFDSLGLHTPALKCEALLDDWKFLL